MSEEENSGNGAATPGDDQPQVRIKVEDGESTATYTNFCRVNSTPEELILDIGMNANPTAVGDVTIHVDQRIIMNHYTAKRLLSALSMAVQRHEQAFGAIELDVRRRVQALPPGGSSEAPK